MKSDKKKYVSCMNTDMQSDKKTHSENQHS